MKNIKILPFCFAVLFCFLGSCKVYRDVENLKPRISKEEKAGEFVSASLARLVEGDMLFIKTKSDESYYLHYYRLNGTNLMGKLWMLNGKKINPTKTVEIPIAEIEVVKVKKFSPAASLAFTSLIVFGVVLFFSTVSLYLGIGG